MMRRVNFFSFLDSVIIPWDTPRVNLLVIRKKWKQALNFFFDQITHNLQYSEKGKPFIFILS